MLYEAQYDHAIIFVGCNDDHKPCFASKRSITGYERRNLSGSDKRYSFRLENSFSDVVHIFESPIDLMSFQTMQKMKNQEWNKDNYLAIDGASLIGNDISHSEIPVALEWFLMKHPHIKVLVLHLDNDRAGLETSEKIKYHLADRYEIQDCRPKHCKDINDVLARKVLSHQIITR
ncbi:toprim domain-containing protein [Faecalibacillus sp. MSK20_93]|nr:toprim domain-containing protein [Faecalibacillus sp. MSK20_93]